MILVAVVRSIAPAPRPAGKAALSPSGLETADAVPRHKSVREQIQAAVDAVKEAAARKQAHEATKKDFDRIDEYETEKTKRGNRR